MRIESIAEMYILSNSTNLILKYIYFYLNRRKYSIKRV